MMKRSQIYLPMEQWRLLGALSRQERLSVSELIRRAIARIYKGQEADFEKALRQAAGLWKDREDLPPAQAYVRGLRRGGRISRLYRGHA
ncbi:MAG: ribbon-helix-helix domain-containing protein [Elusimicrobia bacterium]|nr:ribbon-helix-helix domain-containing protein [Elusimicrobiota bacterium]